MMPVEKRKAMQEFVEINRNYDNNDGFRFYVKMDVIYQRDEQSAPILFSDKLKIVCFTNHITNVIACIENNLANEYADCFMWGYEIISIKFKGVVKILDKI